MRPRAWLFRNSCLHELHRSNAGIVGGVTVLWVLYARDMQQMRRWSAAREGGAESYSASASLQQDDGSGVSVQFSDGSQGRFDLVIGADGLYSQTRQTLFPEAPAPEATGQSVWRYNFARPPELVNLHNYVGPRGIGLAPLSPTLMYMFLTTPEPGNPRFERNGLAAAMRARLANPPPGKPLPKRTALPFRAAFATGWPPARRS